MLVFMSAPTKRDGGLERRERELNGQPARVVVRDGCAIAAILISVVDGKIRNVFIHADPDHLGQVSAAD